MNPIEPTEIRYIKLGAGGSWVQVSLDRGEIHFGYRTVSHDLCLRGDWDAVIQFLTDEGRSLGKARDAAREIRDFYTLDSNCLWITFADGHLWWATPSPESPGSGWRKTDRVLGCAGPSMAGTRSTYKESRFGSMT